MTPEVDFLRVTLEVVHLEPGHLAVVAVGGIGAVRDVHGESREVGRGLEAITFA